MRPFKALMHVRTEKAEKTSGHGEGPTNIIGPQSEKSLAVSHLQTLSSAQKGCDWSKANMAQHQKGGALEVALWAIVSP